MFADVAGSTAIYENLGDVEARERISRALNSLISICKRHKGVLVKTIGDEILVYFQDVDLSVLAAQNIQEAMEDDRSPETVGISIRIGMHFGQVLFEDNDIFGDTVNTAARVVAMAKARQVMFSGDLAKQIKSAELSYKSRQYDRLRVKGKEEPLDIYLYTWEEEGDVTNMATASNLTNPLKSVQPDTLNLLYEKQEIVLDQSSSVFNIGRGKDCDLIVNGDLISRYHARIEIRRGKFLLFDQSTNGTYVRAQDDQNFFLRREDLTLFGTGMISLGKNIERAKGNVIHFFCA
jgi:hypothetical protein